MASMNQKNASADNKWEVRVKEYESRLKAAEERVKRERQGSKERVAELENNLKSVPFFLIDFDHGADECRYRSLQRQFELAQKRNQQLNEVIDNTKPAASPVR